ncbi:MAG: T9SS type A sorting domain-containing protein [Ignavibacteriales bacterium]|nr:T9SS type A sorting domain-containing protein [Ignavibacteriales bacterium]
MNTVLKTSLMLLFPLTLFAQSSSVYRAYGILNGYSISSVFSNYGVFSQPSLGHNPRGAWHQPNNGYIGDLSFVIGLELPIKDYDGNGTLDTLHGVVITAVSRPGGGKDVDGYFSGFEPLPGYNNPVQLDKGIALSDDPTTWPASWPDHPEYPANTWNGLLGANVFIPGREALFVVDDANERTYFKRYGFLPDSTNPSRKGYGLEVKVRVIQSSLPELADALIFVYEIKNNSKYTYNKMVLGELNGSYIGIAGNEWNDDYVALYPKDDLVITGDFDNWINPSSNPTWIGPVGKYGNTFIESPGQQKIGSFYAFMPSGNIRMGDDESMWQRIIPGTRVIPANTTYGNDSIPLVSSGADCDNLYGTHSFSLAPGAVKRISSVLAFGYNKDEIYSNIMNASALYFNNFNRALNAARLSFNSHMNNPQLSGTSTIQWQSSSLNQGTVDIDYSADKGSTWTRVAVGISNSGSFFWNTLTYADSKFGMLRILLKDTDGNKVAIAQSNKFTINNAYNAAPFLSFNNIFQNQTINDSIYQLNISAADPENSIINLKLYSVDNETVNSAVILEKNLPSDTLDQIIPINLCRAPNTNHLSLQAVISDGQNTITYASAEFIKQTTTGYISTNNYSFISGHTSAQVLVRIGDKNLINSHSYTITFDDTTNPGVEKFYSVWSDDGLSYLLRNKTLRAGYESEMFDGIYFQANDFFTSKDTAKSKWHINNANSLPLINFSPLTVTGVKVLKSPRDYAVVFSNSYNETSNDLDNLLGSHYPVYTNLNFRVYDITSGVPERIKFAHISSSLFSSDTLSANDALALSDAQGKNLAWVIRFTGSQNSYIPQGGDTLYFCTNKGLSFYDTLRISGLTLDVKSEQGPVFYAVSQNYPNPFNPSTTVRYAVPQRSMVNIQVFNTLGQLVKTVINTEQQPGTYTVALNMQGFASGIYFYRVTIGIQTATKKMLLLR